MKAKLVVVGGEVKAAEIGLKLPVIIGRGREATLTLPHPLVSRKHCELFEVDGVLMVRDLGSLNGTYVGSQRVTESSLPAGELLTIATVNFRAVYDDVDEDTTNPPNDRANNDSTHGIDCPATRAVLSKPASDSGAVPDTARPPADPVASDDSVEPDTPVERETEWQLGNLPQADSKDDDDLSSLLNDSR